MNRIFPLVPNLYWGTEMVPKLGLGARIKDLASFPAGDRQPPAMV